MKESLALTILNRVIDDHNRARVCTNSVSSIQLHAPHVHTHKDSMRYIHVCTCNNQVVYLVRVPSISKQWFGCSRHIVTSSHVLTLTQKHQDQAGRELNPEPSKL